MNGGHGSNTYVIDNGAFFTGVGNQILSPVGSAGTLEILNNATVDLGTAASQANVVGIQKIDLTHDTGSVVFLDDTHFQAMASNGGQFIIQGGLFNEVYFETAGWQHTSDILGANPYAVYTHSIAGGVTLEALISTPITVHTA